MTPAQQETALILLQNADFRDSTLQRKLNELLIELGLEHAPRLGSNGFEKDAKKWNEK